MSQKMEIGSRNDNVQTVIRLIEKEDKLRAFIVETVDGVEQPSRMAFVDVIGEGQKAFLTVRAPLRVKDAEGQFETRLRQRDGQFLDAKGKPVESEDQAAREFVYMAQKNDAEKLVYGQVATLNIKNTKADGSPTAMTLISAKVYTDDEALAAERLNYKMTAVGKEHPEYNNLLDELRALRRANGVWQNFFINSGADLLRDRGFEVRTREKADTSV